MSECMSNNYKANYTLTIQLQIDMIEPNFV